MRNYIIGLLTGIAAGLMCGATPPPAWYLSLFFVAGSGLVAFGLDVFFGSREEHQSRAAWMGLTLFGVPGFVFLSIVWRFGF